LHYFTNIFWTIKQTILNAVPFIEIVDEPGVCKYRMKICVPHLCAFAGVQDASASDATGSDTSDSARTPMHAPPVEVPTDSDGKLSQGQSAVDESVSTPVDVTSTNDAEVRTDLPPQFASILWSNVIAQHSPELQAITDGDAVVGIAPVRWG
jgi:hypothetical protein